MASKIPFKTLRDGSKMPTLGLGTYLAGGEPTLCALKGSYRLIDTASLYE